MLVARKRPVCVWGGGDAKGDEARLTVPLHIYIKTEKDIHKLAKTVPKS